MQDEKPAQRAGRPSDGFGRLAASLAIDMRPAGAARRVAIAAALEALRKRYTNCPEDVNTESIARTMRRIESGEQQRVETPVDLKLAAIAALEQHPQSDEAAALLAQLKISINDFTSAAHAYLARKKS